AKQKLVPIDGLQDISIMHQSIRKIMNIKEIIDSELDGDLARI
mgnify:CR=1